MTSLLRGETHLLACKLNKLQLKLELDNAKRYNCKHRLPVDAIHTFHSFLLIRKQSCCIARLYACIYHTTRVKTHARPYGILIARRTRPTTLAKSSVALMAPGQAMAVAAHYRAGR